MLRTLSERTTVVTLHQHLARGAGTNAGRHTLILPNILEGKRQARVFALDYADFAEGAFADDAKESEVVQVDWTTSGSAAVDGHGGGGETNPRL